MTYTWNHSKITLTLTLFKKIGGPMKSKFMLCLLILTVLFSFQLVAKGEMESGESKKEINVPAMAGWTVMEEVKKHTDAFSKETGISVKYHDYPHAEMMAKVVQENQADTGAFDTAMAGAINQGIIEPYMMSLNDFIVRDFGSIEAFREQFYPWAIDFGIYDDEIKFLQFHVNAEYCVYNANLFNDPAEKANFKAEYGYELAPPQTPDQLEDIAEFFTRPEKDLWGFVIMAKGPPGGWALISRLYGAGFRTVDIETGEVPFAEEPAKSEAVEAVQWWVDLIDKYGVMPEGTAAIAHRDCYEMFIGNHAAMSFGWWGDFYPKLADPAIVEDIGETGSFAFPVQQEDNGLPISTWGIGISNDSENPESSWEFIKFMLSENMQHSLSENVGQGSPIKEYNKTAIDNRWVAAAMDKELKRGTMPVRIPEGWDILNLYFQNASGLFSMEMDSEEFIELVIEETHSIMH